MRRLILRGLLLAAPFILIAAVVGVIDPYDYFGPSRIIADSVKEQTAQQLQFPLWKWHQFRRAPRTRILLGDSRMVKVRPSTIRDVSGEDYFNFSYNGGTLTEAVETYWMASSLVHLDAVYLEMGLIGFNAYQTLNRVPDVTSMDANPLLYLSNRLVVRAAALTAYAAWTGKKMNLETPPMGRDAWWKLQLDESLPQVLNKYAYPAVAAKQLEEVAADCRRRGTRLVIIIPPTHVDAQRRVAELGRSADDARFRQFAATLGEVYDFDFPSELTSDQSKFNDPLHLQDYDVVVREVWGTERLYVHHSK